MKNELASCWKHANHEYFISKKCWDQVKGRNPEQIILCSAKILDEDVRYFQ